MSRFATKWCARPQTLSLTHQHALQHAAHLCDDQQTIVAVSDKPMLVTYVGIPHSVLFIWVHASALFRKIELRKWCKRPGAGTPESTIRSAILPSMLLGCH